MTWLWYQLMREKWLEQHYHCFLKLERLRKLALYAGDQAILQEIAWKRRKQQSSNPTIPLCSWHPDPPNPISSFLKTLTKPQNDSPFMKKDKEPVYLGTILHQHLHHLMIFLLVWEKGPNILIPEVCL